MEHYAGIDVSLEQSSVCVVEATGRIVREARVRSEPGALIRVLRGPGSVRWWRSPSPRRSRAGPVRTSQWLHAGLTKAGLEVVLLETRQVKAALSAMVVKTDRKDARGIAQLLRMGWFRPGALQVAAGPGGARTAGRAQAAAEQAFGHRAEHPRHLARLRAQGRNSQQRPVRGAHPGARLRPGDAGTGD